MTPERVKELLSENGAIIEGHFVGTGGVHLSHYVAKDRVTRKPSVVSELCEGIANIFAPDHVDIVVAPAVGAIALSQWTAHHLTRLSPSRGEVLALYSEPDDKPLCEKKTAVTGGIKISITAPKGSLTFLIGEGEVAILRHQRFVLKRGFSKDVQGKRVLVVEDTLSTGSSARRTVDAVRSAGGLIVGLGVFVNGGGVSPETCGVSRLEALMTLDRRIYHEAECACRGMCAEGVPINTEFGHGASFLARREMERKTIPG